MAETRRQRSYLTSTSFVTNATGNITAQDVREMIESMMGAYAAINNTAGDGTPTTQAVATATTVTLDWDGGTGGANGLDDTDASTYGADADYANDRIRIYDEGIYLVNLSLAMSQSINASVIWDVVLATQPDGGAVSETAYKTQRTIANNTDVAHTTISGLIDTSAHTDYTDVLLRLNHDNGSSNNLTLYYAQMTVTRVG